MGGSYIEDWNFLVAQHSQFYNQPEYKIQALWENYFSEIFGFKKILNEIDSQRKLPDSRKQIKFYKKAGFSLIKGCYLQKRN